MIEGGCHCGRITVALDADPTEAKECNCSHCSKKGYLLAFYPREKLTVTAADEDVATYTFNRHFIRHHFCRVCGCAPYAEADGPKEPMAAVNLRCFDVDVLQLKILPIDGKRF